MNATTISAYITKLENENKLLRAVRDELNDDAAEYRVEIFRLKAVIEDLEEELDEDYESDGESVVSTEDYESDDDSIVTEDEESDEESDDEDDFHISRNAAIVNALRKLSDLEKDDFKSKAYWKAAEAVDNIPYTIVDGESLAKGETKVPGIGKSIAKKIDEFLETGLISRLEDLKKKPPTTNECIFDALGEVSARESDIHKKAAYKKAAQAIKNLDFEVTSGEELAKGPNKVAGIGKSIGRKIDNFLQFGEMK
jgi:DNA uptake protein ComE-like DNA-binding protein